MWIKSYPLFTCNFKIINQKQLLIYHKKYCAYQEKYNILSNLFHYFVQKTSVIYVSNLTFCSFNTQQKCVDIKNVNKK